jgi:hypothetical protein
MKPKLNSQPNDEVHIFLDKSVFFSEGRYRSPYFQDSINRVRYSHRDLAEESVIVADPNKTNAHFQEVREMRKSAESAA